jgi:hypothetical protein
MDINLNLPTLPTQDQKDAMDGANTPDSTNVFVTANDLTIPTLQEVSDSGNTTTNDIQFDSGAGILLDNTSRLREGTIDAGFGGTKGIAQICAVGYELKWEAGRLYVMDGNGVLIRHSLHNFTTIPSANDDSTKGYYVGSLWTLDNGVSYICTDSTSTAATWILYEAVPQVNSDWNAVGGVAEILNKPTLPTKTSDLTNDGDDGNPFISLNDLPSNLILYATNVASDIPTYVKLVSSITDPSYNTVAVNVSTGSITTTNQFISALITLPNLIVGNPGVINISTIGNIRRTAGTGNAEFYFEVYKRTIGGVETLITTSGNTLPVFNGTYAEFSATALWNDGIFLATDRIVLKFYGTRIAGGSNPTYDFQFGGTTPVRSLVPIPLTVTPFITLDEVADVTISGVANNDLLAYESSTSLWKNKTASTLGIVETTDSRFDNAGEWIQLNGPIISPADSTNYNIPQIYIIPSNSATARQFKFAKSGTVNTITLNMNQSGNGSSELSTVYLRNNTTGVDNLVGTFSLDGGVNANTFVNYTTSITVNDTDAYLLKISTPAWVTNPTNCYFAVRIFNKS